jgi:nucleotide-binding universal stress UspA family protein
MAVKDILVHIDSRETCAGRLDVAVRFAKYFNAHLKGLYVQTRSDQATLVTEAEITFKKATSDAGVESEWVCVDSAETKLDVVNAINLYSHYRDIVIVSQTDPDCRDRSIPADLPEKVVLGSGRPVLIIPYAGNFPHIGDRITLAWRGGAESARAVQGARTLMQQAKRVSVFRVLGASGDVNHEFHQGDILKHLKRYDIDARAEQITSAGISVGDTLLNHAADADDDLLVIGAFAQSRGGTHTLGEVGQYLLKYMTVPVLMNH